jgi:hypothetical protein
MPSDVSQLRWSGRDAIPDGIRRLFTEGFRVADVAEPLASFDEGTPPATIAAFMEANDFEAVGVHRGGRVCGYAASGDATLIGFDRATVLPDSTPLAAAVEALASGPRVFVSAFGEVAGIVTKSDMQKPPVRMWLFGMVTMIELRYGRLIDELCPDDSWKQYLSEGRVKKAEELLAERRRRKQGELTLLDCLQLSDKGQIVARNEEIRRLTIFASRNQAEDGIKQLESLRNNLAHAQDIVAMDWDAIVNLTRQLRRVLAPAGEVTSQ